MTGTYTVRDLDALFSFKPQKNRGGWWHRHWKDMVERQGFPAPIAGIRRLTWSRATVDAWLEKQGASVPAASTVSTAPPPPINHDAPPNLAALRRAL